MILHLKPSLMWCMLFVGNTNLTNMAELGDLTLVCSCRALLICRPYSCDFCEMWCLVRLNWRWTRPCILWNSRTSLQSVRRCSKLSPLEVFQHPFNAAVVVVAV